MKKELLIFVCILIVLSFLIHYKDFLTHPFLHILNLPKSDAYGFGFLHPIIFTLTVYLVISFLRFMIRFFFK